jgi:hypothetical protein
MDETTEDAKSVVEEELLAGSVTASDSSESNKTLIFIAAIAFLVYLLEMK